jgi:hypothetical protein
MRVPDFQSPLPTKEIDIRNRCTEVLCVAATTLRSTELHGAIYAISIGLGGGMQEGTVEVARSIVETHNGPGRLLLAGPPGYQGPASPGAAGRTPTTIGPTQGCNFMDVGSPNAAGEISTSFAGIPHPRHVFEKVKVAAEDATEAMQAACTTVFDFAAALNVELIEAGRANSNAALQFMRTIVALKSPLELPGLMTAYARKQCDLWAEQTREVSNVAQKAAREVVGNSPGKVFKKAA